MARARTTGGAPPSGATVGNVGATHALPLQPGVAAHLHELFPDRLIPSELGEIPEEWEVQTVGEHMVNWDSRRVSLLGAARLKRRAQYPYHAAGGAMDYVDDYLFDGIYLLVGGDGSVEQNNGAAITQYVWGKIWVNSHAHVLPGRGAVSTEQIYPHFHFEPLAPYVTGAVPAKLSQGRMNMMQFFFVGELLCRAFERTIQPWFARIRASFDEERTLAAPRDASLPKLISDEICIKSAQRSMGGAA